MEICHITPTVAGMTLTGRVLQATVNYFRSLKEGAKAVATSILNDGIQVIWQKIKGKVADIMFEEFGSLYKDKENENFTALIETAESIPRGTFASLPELLGLSESVKMSTQDILNRRYHPCVEKFLSWEPAKKEKYVDFFETDGRTICDASWLPIFASGRLLEAETLRRSNLVVPLA